MNKKVVGDGQDLAEMIIDYDKKTIQMLDPVEGGNLKESDFPDIPASFLILFVASIIGVFVGHTFGQELLFVVSLSIGAFMVAIVSVRIVARKLHYYGQIIFNGKLALKKKTTIKDIDTKIYKFPYDFKNIKFDWKLYGDYKKQIRRIHIKPLDYYEYRFGKPKKQIENWTVHFHFKKIPQKGRMEIIWI